LHTSTAIGYVIFVVWLALWGAYGNLEYGKLVPPCIKLEKLCKIYRTTALKLTKFAPKLHACYTTVAYKFGQDFVYIKIYMTKQNLCV